MNLDAIHEGLKGAALVMIFSFDVLAAVSLVLSRSDSDVLASLVCLIVSLLLTLEI
jgi:hypothetical protein